MLIKDVPELGVGIGKSGFDILVTSSGFVVCYLLLGNRKLLPSLGSGDCILIEYKTKNTIQPHCWGSWIWMLKGAEGAKSVRLKVNEHYGTCLGSNRFGCFMNTHLKTFGQQILKLEIGMTLRLCSSFTFPTSEARSRAKWVDRSDRFYVQDTCPQDEVPCVKINRNKSSRWKLVVPS